MIKVSWLIIIFIFFNYGLSAQKKKGVMRYEDKLSIRVSPLGLIDVFDGNLTAGIIYSLNNRWSLSTDLSCIFYSAYLNDNMGSSGYIVKPSVRYYVSDTRKFFFESSVWYKRSTYKLTDWLDMDCVNGVPAFRELKDFRFRKRVLGWNVQGGFQKGLMKNNKLRMEIYAGLGIRFKWQDIKDEPSACYDPNSFFINEIYSPYNVGVSIPHGMRLVYVIE